MLPDNTQTDVGQDREAESERLANVAEKEESEQMNRMLGVFSTKDMLAAFRHGLEYEYFDTGGMDAELPEKNQPFYDWVFNYKTGQNKGKRES